MATRPQLPKATQQAVLKEFNHLCAICGKPNPHIHHIDGDNSNNARGNLLPLCPNHHLLDAHSPTSPMSAAKLNLFRRFRDPTVFFAQFQPVFERLKPLLEGDLTDGHWSALRASSDDLIAFVACLGMGAYYAKQLEKLVGWQTHFEASRAAKNPIMSPEEYQKGLDQAAESYPFHVDAGKDRAVELVVECLRFQDWKAKSAYTDA